MSNVVPIGIRNGAYVHQLSEQPRRLTLAALTLPSPCVQGERVQGPTFLLQLHFLDHADPVVGVELAVGELGDHVEERCR